MKFVTSLLIVVGLGLLSFMLVRHWEQVFPESTAIVIQADCDLAAEACVSELPGGGKIKLKLSPSPIVLMNPLYVDVTVRNSDLMPQYIDITGLNMEMGLNRTGLDSIETGHWKGETILPICSQRRMHWQLRLQLVKAEKRYHLNYEFFTQGT